MTTSHYEAWLREVAGIATAAGQRILEVYNGPFNVEIKEDHSPLTLADQLAHELIAARLANLTPQIPVLSEESIKIDYSVRAKWERYWLVDPLDGTREFVKRNGEFTVNIALVESGQPVLGVVQVPVTGVLYLAVRGLGAWKEHDGRRRAIHVRRYQGGRATVVASRSHRGEHVDQFLNLLEAREGPYEIASLGSSLKLCLVAEGDADIYPRFGPTSEWDTAAAQCVVTAAGGVVVDAQGATLRYNKPDILNPWFFVIGDTGYHWRDIIDGVVRRESGLP